MILPFHSSETCKTSWESEATKFTSHGLRSCFAAPPPYIGLRCALGLGGRYLALLRVPLDLLPLRARLPFPLRARSWSSFCDITDSQKWPRAPQDLPLPSMALTIAGNKRSGPTPAYAAPCPLARRSGGTPPCAPARSNAETRQSNHGQ